MGTLAEIAKNCTKLVSKKSPLIFTAAGIGLGVSSTIMAVKVTPEAHDIYTKIQESDMSEQEKRKEVVKSVLPLYGPAALTGGLAIASVVTGYKINSNRLAEMTAAYVLANNGLQDYRKTVLEKFGQDKAEEVDKEVAEKQAERTPDAPIKTVPVSNDPNEEVVLLLDNLTGQYFRDTKDHVWQVLNDIQYRLGSGAESYISASEYAYELDLNQSVALDHIGWVAGSQPTPKFTKFIGPKGEDAYLISVDTDPLFETVKPRYY